MTKLKLDISTSLDGYVAGPDVRDDQPLGAGGERLHDWAYDLRSFREPHGLEGGEEGQDADILEEAFASLGAAIMGRGMFGGGPGPWDESWRGHWGDAPPFDHPVFVLTHHPRERIEFTNGASFTFVTDGIESALDQARAAAGDKDVGISGGAAGGPAVPGGRAAGRASAACGADIAWWRDPPVRGNRGPAVRARAGSGRALPRRDPPEVPRRALGAQG